MSQIQSRWTIACALVLAIASTSFSENVFIDLSKQFDRDAFVSGEGQGNALNEDGNWLDAASLPADYAKDSAYPTVDGLSEFLYGDLANGAADCLRVNGQSLQVPAGEYDRLQMALLSTGGFLDLGRFLTLNYVDGSSDQLELGPLAGWFDSPARYYDSFFRWVDDSGIKEILNLHLQVDDQDYIVESTGSSTEPRDDYRFVDGGGVLTYEIDFDDSIDTLTMGIDMSNNFVVGISTDFGETYEEVLNSQTMFGEDVHSGSNRKIYTVDLAPFLAQYPDKVIRVRFTDGTTNNGWGPSIWNIVFYTGQTKTYEGEPKTAFDAENAEIFVDFRTDGGSDEAKYLVDQNSVSNTSAKHRFADGSGYFIYHFDLPNDVEEAKAAINMEGDFVVSAASARSLETLVDVVPGNDRDTPYFFENSNSSDAGEYRFMDGGSYVIYTFDLPKDLTQAKLEIDMENNFVVSVGSDVSTMETALNSMDIYGKDVHDASNRKIYEIELDKYLKDNPNKYLFLMFEDGSTTDGWGPAVRRIKITSGTEAVYTSVLTAEETFASSVNGYNQASTENKGYYTADFSSFLKNNPTKELYVKFTDGSPANGWGPGIFRFVMYGGELTPRIDGSCIKGLGVIGESPTNQYPWGTTIVRRDFAVNANKTLKSVSLPTLNAEQNIYLFGATLEGGATSISEWSLY